MRPPFLSLSPSLRLLSSVLWLLGLSPASAQDARSAPVGFIVQTIPSGQTRSFSVPFDAEASSLPHTVGKLTAVGSDYLENSAAAWTPGAFSTVEAPYYVRLTSGANAGRTFRILTPANTATRLYLATDGVDLTTLGLTVGGNGTSFEILPGDTLASFFGATMPADTLVLQGATNPATADVVQIWGGAAWLNFYYNTAWQRWARDSDLVTDPTRNHFPLRSDHGLMITRRGATPLDLAVLGRVLTGPQVSTHTRTENALTFLATMQTGDITLGALALQSGARSEAWRGAASAVDADILLVWSGATWFSFFYNTAAGEWQLVGDPVNRGTFVIKAGTPIFVQRRAAGATPAEKTITFPAPGT